MYKRANICLRGMTTVLDPMQDVWFKYKLTFRQFITKQGYMIYTFALEEKKKSPIFFFVAVQSEGALKVISLIVLRRVIP